MPSSISETVDSAVLGSLMIGKKLGVTVAIRKDEDDGFFIAECLEIPGCMSQGKTEEEAKENIKDAINSCLLVMLTDCLARQAAQRQQPLNLVGIEKQEAFTIVPPHLLQPSNDLADVHP